MAKYNVITIGTTMESHLTWDKRLNIYFTQPFKWACSREKRKRYIGCHLYIISDEGRINRGEWVINIGTRWNGVKKNELQTSPYTLNNTFEFESSNVKLRKVVATSDYKLNEILQIPHNILEKWGQTDNINDIIQLININNEQEETEEEIF